MIYRPRISLMLYKVTLTSWGLAPKPPASTLTQKQGDELYKELCNFAYIIILIIFYVRIKLVDNFVMQFFTLTPK